MKKILRNIVYRALVFLAKVRLRRLKHAKIIGVTGSAGKTTTKDALKKVLEAHFSVIANKKSYNTEFGLPLTILEADAGFSSPILWMINILKAKYNAYFSRKKVDFFILEMGVDKVGDMRDLTAIVQPDIAIFSNVKPVHLNPGQFKNLDEVYEEKSIIVKNLKKNGVAIINVDDDRVKKLTEIQGKLHEEKGIKFIGFGLNKEAKLHAEDIKTTLSGISFTAVYGNLRAKFEIPILGEQHVYCFLPVIACALECGLYMNDIAESLKHFCLPPGRMSLIEGINGSVIIDSSYNASPEATIAALNTMKDLAETKRKIFVFGNMNELGENSPEYHKEVGAHAAKTADIMLCVGEFAKIAGEEAIKNGLDKSNVGFFSSALVAAEFAKDLIKKEDILLVKGSQNKVRLERFVKALMAHPEKANELLCRQEKTWQKIG
ncbi:MAG: UDP-N-acetylmuramoyl-tripeptide--D-alanyl-D-alanine ligase [Candidatus Gracilibacteria bacterium]